MCNVYCRYYIIQKYNSVHRTVIKDTIFIKDSKYPQQFVTQDNSLMRTVINVVKLNE